MYNVYLLIVKYGRLVSAFLCHYQALFCYTVKIKYLKCCIQMVTLNIHSSSWNRIPFYIVVCGFYVYYFSVSKIFLKITMPYVRKVGLC